MNYTKEHTNIWLEIRPYVPFLEQLAEFFDYHECRQDAAFVKHLVYNLKKFNLRYKYMDKVKTLVGNLYQRYAGVFEIPTAKEETDYGSDTDTIYYDF